MEKKTESTAKTVAERLNDEFAGIETVTNMYGTFKNQKKLVDWLRSVEGVYYFCRFFPYGGGTKDPVIAFVFPDGSYMEIDNPRQRSNPAYVYWKAKK